MEAEAGVQASVAPSPLRWLEDYCLSMDGQFVFLDPVSWQTHLLTEGAALVLREAALAIEEARFDAFRDEVVEVGGWPPALEQLANTLNSLHHHPGGRAHG